MHIRTFISLTSLLLALSPGQAQAGMSLPDDPSSEVVEAGPEDEARALDEIAGQDFEFPEVSPELAEEIDRTYPHVDPKHVVPKKLLRQALAFYKANLNRIKNRDSVTVVDYSQKSSQDRMFLINMKSGSVWSIHVAHGKGSDKNNDGMAEKFSNKLGSEASSLGFFLTAETYVGNHGRSMRLDGLSPTNSNARVRNVVVHGADYVSTKDVKPGRSWGCLAVSQSERDKVISALDGGSLIYSGQSR